MTTVVGIDVTVKVRDKSSCPDDKCPLAFSYSGHDAASQSLLDVVTGDIYLTQVKDDVEIVFYLKPAVLEWNNVKYKASLQQAGSTTSKNALWIWKVIGGTPGPYQGGSTPSQDEFHDFKHGTLAPNQPTTKVRSNNKELENYYYNLSVYLYDPAGKEVECRHDPQIKNGGLHGHIGFKFQMWFNLVLALALIVSLAIGLRHLWG